MYSNHLLILPALVQLQKALYIKNHTSLVWLDTWIKIDSSLFMATACSQSLLVSTLCGQRMAY